jgi:hypothetical protein
MKPFDDRADLIADRRTEHAVSHVKGFRGDYPTWKDDPEVAEYIAFFKKYSPEADPNDWANVIAYYHAAGGASVDRMRRRADARKPDASGNAHGPRARADAVAGHHLRYEPDRLLAGQANAAETLRRHRWVGFGGIVNG